MTYENIKSSDPNVAVVDNNFFIFDYYGDVLRRKVDDGDTAFEYPTDTDVSRYTVSDPFESLRYDLWDFSGNYSIVDGNLRMTSVGGADVGIYSEGYSSTEDWVLRGNFDIRVYFEIQLYDNGPSYWDAPCFNIRRLSSDPNSNYRLQISRRCQGANNHVYRAWYYNGSWTVIGSIYTVTTSNKHFLRGALRYYRSGSTTYCYFWNSDNNAWTQIGSNSSIISSVPVRFQTIVNSWENNPDVTMDAIHIDVQSILSMVKSVQYDGKYFWTLQEISGSNQEFLVRKWYIRDYNCEIQEQFFYTHTDLNTYDAGAFALENYMTKFSNSVSTGDKILTMGKYYDSVTVVASGTVLSIGPNSSGYLEDITVSGVVGSNVYLMAPLQYNYSIDDQISLCNSFFIFNEYYGTSSAEGSLMRFSAYDGGIMSLDHDVEYQSVSAATFYRFQNILEDYPDAHALIYVKGAQAKLRDMSDLIEILRAETVNDYFTGSDMSYPNTTNWVRTGTPYIYDNQLFCGITIDGTDQIDSKYVLTGDFDVQISGSMGGHHMFSTYSRFSHYIGIEVLANECEIGITKVGPYIPQTNLYAEYLGTISGSTLFDTSGNGWDATITGSPTHVDGVTGKCLYFRGTSYADGVTLLTHSGVAPIEEEFSFSTWFKSDTIVGDPNARIIGRDCSDYFCTYVNQSESFPQSFVFHYSDTQNTSLGQIVQQNTWHHIVGAWCVSGTRCKLYMDGDEIFSTDSLAAFSTNPRPIVIGCNTEEFINPTASQFEGYIDDVRIYDKELLISDVKALYKDGLIDHADEFVLYTSLNDVFTTTSGLTISGSELSDYRFRITRNSGELNFYYRPVTTGTWTFIDDMTFGDVDCNIYIGLHCIGATVSGSYFDDLIYDSGLIYYPSDDIPYYGVMQMDNVRKNGSTIIDVYDLSVDGDSLYRLQDEGTYYNTDNSWSTYNYQISPIRSFIDAITVQAYPVILPANGRNVSLITCLVLDQYSEGPRNRPISFTDTDSVGFITRNPVYTDPIFKTGEATTIYKAGVDIHTVTVEGTVTQYD